MLHESQPHVPDVPAWRTHSVPLTRMTPDDVYQAWRAQWWKRLALSELGRIGRTDEAPVAQRSARKGRSKGMFSGPRN